MAESRRFCEFAIDGVDLRFELPFGLDRRLARAVADAEREQAGLRLREMLADGSARPERDDEDDLLHGTDATRIAGCSGSV